MSSPDCWMALKQKIIWFILHFFNIQILKRKKKRSTYWPSQFSGQKGKQIFIFLGLSHLAVLSHASVNSFVTLLVHPCKNTIPANSIMIYFQEIVCYLFPFQVQELADIYKSLNLVFHLSRHFKFHAFMATIRRWLPWRHEVYTSIFWVPSFSTWERAQSFLGEQWQSWSCLTKSFVQPCLTPNTKQNKKQKKSMFPAAHPKTATRNPFFFFCHLP